MKLIIKWALALLLLPVKLLGTVAGLVYHSFKIGLEFADDIAQLLERK